MPTTVTPSESVKLASIKEVTKPIEAIKPIGRLDLIGDAFDEILSATPIKESFNHSTLQSNMFSRIVTP